MNTNDLIRELENVEKKYKDRKTFTFEVCISDMAHDCVKGLKAMQAENATLRDERDMYKNHLTTQKLIDSVNALGEENRKLHFENKNLRADLTRYRTAENEGWIRWLPDTGIGDLSDGYHTFNELYHHRAVLFSVICNLYLSRAWKSKKHHDGTMFDGMFIVGINTPYGQATYHYDIKPYWDYFGCLERDLAPEWDGHTPNEAIERLLKLGSLDSAQAALEAQTDEH